MKTTKWLILFCLFGMVGTGVSAYDFESGGIYYNITSSGGNETCSVTSSGSYNSYSGRVTIPSSVSYGGKTYSVTSIAAMTFFRCSSLTSITIGNSVASIGAAAFQGCSSLASVTIPSSVISIGINPFSGCSSLTSIVVNKDNPIYDSRNDCNAIIETASNTLIVGCQKTIIPNSVTSIRTYAFSGCSSLTSVIIPNSVTSIGEHAFSDCTSLASVTLPNSITSTGSLAFSGCSSLTSVTIPGSVTSIGYGAFSDCSSLTSVTIPGSVTSIGGSAFSGCSSLTSVTIPGSVTSIGGSAFSGCSSLTSVTIPGSVTSIGGYAFSRCSSLPVFGNIRYADTYAIGAVDKTQSTYTIKDGTKWVGDDAFYGCSGLVSVTIPGSVTSIGIYAFRDCTSLTSVSIPSLVTAVGESTFYGCSNLTSITIPGSVTSIGGSAFSGCSSLTSVTIPGSVTSIGDNAFGGCISLTSVAIQASVTSIGKSTFNGCRNLTSVAIPSSVTSIGSYAFQSCSSLTSITIPNSVTSIGENAFSSCTSLTSITIPNSVISIGEGAFSNCYSLPVFGNIRYADTYAIYTVDKRQSTYTIKDGTKWIGACALCDCSNLTSITIPGSVTSIGRRAFENCSSLTSVVSLIQEPFPFGTSAFSQIADNCVLTIPAGTREAYIAQGWSEYIFRGGIVEMTPQEITLVDGTAFENDVEEFYDEINYIRTFNNTKWQSLYVPFEIPITEELLEEFEFAYINAARQYDYDDDGEIDNLTIEIFKVKSGTLRANHPYLIRAKVAGEKTITVNKATLYATEENSIDCSTTALKFTFTGGYQTLNYDDIGGCYLLGGGTWNEVKEGGTMKPMRFYLKIESRGNGQVIPASAAAKPIRMTVFGEDDEVTVVQSPLLQEGAGEAPVFDLQGRRVEYPENGIYIINGKKVIVK